jgi:hypothetical protein
MGVEMCVVVGPFLPSGQHFRTILTKSKTRRKEGDFDLEECIAPRSKLLLK